MEGPHLLEERSLEIIHLIKRQVLQQTLCSAIEDCHLLPYRHRRILRLDQQPVVLSTLVQSHGSDRIHIAAEL